MPQWFKVPYSYTEPLDDSTVGTRNLEFAKMKTVTETLIVDAISFGDAETRALVEVSVNGRDITINDVSRFKLADLFRYETGEDWYLAKVDFITENERTGKVQRRKVRMLVNAETPKQAYDRIEEKMKTSLDPFEITDVDKTKIVDVLEFAVWNTLEEDKVAFDRSLGV